MRPEITWVPATYEVLLPDNTLLNVWRSGDHWTAYASGGGILGSYPSLPAAMQACEDHALQDVEID